MKKRVKIKDTATRVPSDTVGLRVNVDVRDGNRIYCALIGEHKLKEFKSAIVAMKWGEDLINAGHDSAISYVSQLPESLQIAAYHAYMTGCAHRQSEIDAIRDTLRGVHVVALLRMSDSEYLDFCRDCKMEPSSETVRESVRAIRANAMDGEES